MKGFARGAAIVVVLLGVAGLVFGILLLVAGSTIHSETVKEVEADGAQVEQLKDKRDTLTSARRAYGVPLDPNPLTNPYAQTQLNYLTMEKGAGLSLLSLGLATMITYAGIGTLVMGVALILVGFTQYRMAGHIT